MLDIDPARLALLGDPDTATGREAVRALLCAFATDLDERLPTLRQAVLARDPGVLRERAHRLKGASSMIGARALADACAALEAAAAEPLPAVAALLAEVDRRAERVRREVVRLTRGEDSRGC